MDPDPDEHVHPGEEDLQWGQGIKEKNREKKPQSGYSAISEHARKMFPEESKCKMFCGGKTCKYCTPDNWSPEQMVIKGLYSEWVTDNILAMARMPRENIEKYKMVKQFRDLQVKTIINLQQPGEHAFCGSGNDDTSGFSYNPQTFMAAQFFFYNFAMEDYGVAPVATLLDIVKVMQFAVSLGKVAVHCHAGLGRTGLIIACYLIYNNRVKASKAIQYVRSRRPGAIQTKQQMKTCHEFEQYLKLYYIIFSSKIPDSHAFSFSRFLTRQRHLLHGYEARKLKHIPKVIYVCCERLLELCGKGRSLSSLRHQPVDPLPADLESLYSSTSGRDRSASPLPGSEVEDGMSPRLVMTPPSGRSPRTEQLRQSLSSTRLKDVKDDKKQKLKQTKSTPPNLRVYDKSPDGMTRLHPGSINSLNYASSDDESRSNADNDDEDDDDDDCIVYGRSVEERRAVKLVEKEAKKAEEEEIKMYKERSDSLEDTMSSVLMTVEEVCEAAVQTDYTEDVLRKLDTLEDKLNKKDQAWQELAREEDPHVLCGIMCDWLDQLNEPVLRGQDIYTLIENSDDPQKALLRLEKNTKHFLEYIILVISKLKPLPERILHAVVEFFLSYLCQKKLNLHNISLSSRQAHFGELKLDHASSLFYLFLKLLGDAK